jgi:hypothetical protein
VSELHGMGTCLGLGVIVARILALQPFDFIGRIIG